MIRRSTALVVSTLFALSLSSAVPAQGATDAKLVKTATNVLMRFASFARGKKHGPMEKQAYGLILSEYDADHKRARKALDYSFDKSAGKWVQAMNARRSRWPDNANREGRFKVQREWRAACDVLGKEHRELGLAMRDAAGNLTADGTQHLERALLFNPLDAESHEALGHKPWASGGITYYGTEDEIAFMQRMKEVETFALQLAQNDYEVQPVDAVPDCLNALGLEVYGSKSKHFTIFTRGSQENADDVVMWAERALAFVEFLLGDKHKRNMRTVKARMGRWGYNSYLWTGLEFDDFKEANPDKLGDNPDAFANLTWLENNKICQVSTKLTPAGMQDAIISHVFRYGIVADANEGLGEGLHHAATWFLKSTCMTKWGAIPEGTATEFDLVLPDGANWWLREMRNQAIARTDTPLNAVPRTQLSNYPPEVRLKAWSFWVWAFARYPEKWLDFLLAVPADKIPFPEEVEKAAAEVFERPLSEVEAEWRAWASGRGVTAAATGYGPPLLPEFPNEVELEGLARLNEVRAAAICLPEFERGSDAGKEAEKIMAKNDGWYQGLPECELDSEATAACKDHAIFLGMHKDHWKWPEAHEEDPAKEGFTPKGMRAGLRSVIVMSEGQLDSADSVDQWIGTVYHRFPLLRYAIKRFGMAHAAGPEGEVVVLDMGSLEEPPNAKRDETYAFCAWPPSGSKNIPRQFAYTEHPNPLEDVGLDFDAQKNTGYPVSLQFTDLIVRNAGGVTMQLYEAKKRGGKFDKGEEVPCWLHTPDDPLFKRQVLRDVVFVIPKEVLKANETYLAVVNMSYRGVAKKIEWWFTTGSRMQGLGKL